MPTADIINQCRQRRRRRRRRGRYCWFGTAGSSDAETKFTPIKHKSKPTSCSILLIFSLLVCLLCLSDVAEAGVPIVPTVLSPEEARARLTLDQLLVQPTPFAGRNFSSAAIDPNSLPGVVVFVAPRTALISHEIANRVVSELRQQHEIEFPIRLRKVKCDFAEAVKAVYEMSSLEFRTSFLLTDLCPDVNFRLSQVLKYRNIALITASDNNPAFHDRNMYANTFSTVPSTESLSRATLKFLQQNDWRKMLIVYDAHTPASSYYSLISSALLRFLEQNNVEVGRAIENKLFEQTISNIQKSGIKIVFLLMPAEEIAEFLCQYLRQTEEASVSRLAWLLHTDVADIPIELMLEETCPGVERLKLLTAFAIRFAPYDLMANDTTVLLPHPSRVMCSDRSTRMRPRQSSNAAVAEMVTHPPGYRANSTTLLSHYYRCYYYDSLKSIFRTLRTSLAFSVGNPYDYDVLVKNFRQLNIDGKTGLIKFNKQTCERMGQVEVVQIANGRPRWIVVYDMSHSLTPARHYRHVRWPRGRPPLDSVIRREELLAVPVELLAAFSAAALLGIAASIGILITNIRFRGHSYIKMSSPNLNNFILIGSCLCYCNVVFQGIGTNLLPSTRFFEAVCAIEAWTLPIGFSLAFGAMLTKTWRVHTIFKHTTGFKRQVIPDSRLIVVISSFVLLDVLLNTMWTIFDPQTREITITQTTLADAYETTSFIESCSSSYAMWWTMALWLPKGALLIYGLVLAWKTRGVRLAALNDSYQIGVSIYIIVVLCSIGATAQPLFKTKVVISYCVLSATLLLCTVIPEVVIFVPKLLKLWKDPIGDQKMLREEMKRATKSTDRVANELARRYVTSEVRSRRVRLTELNDEVEKLENQLTQLGNADGNQGNMAGDVSLSFAMVAIGASLMSNPQPLPKPNNDLLMVTPEAHRVSAISDERDETFQMSSSMNKSHIEKPSNEQLLDEGQPKEPCQGAFAPLLDSSTEAIDGEVLATDKKLSKRPESSCDFSDVGGDVEEGGGLLMKKKHHRSRKQLEELRQQRVEIIEIHQTEKPAPRLLRIVTSSSDDECVSSVRKTNPQQMCHSNPPPSSNKVTPLLMVVAASPEPQVATPSPPPLALPSCLLTQPVRRKSQVLNSSSADVKKSSLLNQNARLRRSHQHFQRNGDGADDDASRWQASSLSPNLHFQQVQRSKSSCVNIYCDTETFL